MKQIDKFYMDKEDTTRDCLLSLKAIIEAYNSTFEAKWYYRLPCFMYKNQIFCYLWIDKKRQIPYIAVGKGVKIDHPDLISEKRTFTKKLLIDPLADIPVEKIYHIFDMAMDLYD